MSNGSSAASAQMHRKNDARIETRKSIVGRVKGLDFFGRPNLAASLLWPLCVKPPERRGTDSLFSLNVFQQGFGKNEEDLKRLLENVHVRFGKNEKDFSP